MSGDPCSRADLAALERACTVSLHPVTAECPRGLLIVSGEHAGVTCRCSVNIEEAVRGALGHMGLGAVFEDILPSDEHTLGAVRVRWGQQEYVIDVADATTQHVRAARYFVARELYVLGRRS